MRTFFCINDKCPLDKKEDEIFNSVKTHLDQKFDGIQRLEVLKEKLLFLDEELVNGEESQFIGVTPRKKMDCHYSINSQAAICRGNSSLCEKKS